MDQSIYVVRPQFLRLRQYFFEWQNVLQYTNSLDIPIWIPNILILIFRF